MPGFTLKEFESAIPLKGLLGYLNFSEGKAEPRFQQQLNDAFWFIAQRGEALPWIELQMALEQCLEALQKNGGSAFQDVAQARSVLNLVFQQLLPAYRRHHADLLFHQSDETLWQPFFLAKAFEAVLAQRGPWDQTERIVGGALRQLNDFVGQRPAAVLESGSTRAAAASGSSKSEEGPQRGELYDHERLRPIPLYLRGAGVGSGKYYALVEKALAILQLVEPSILIEAYFSLDNLDELALDPRGYDFDHPADKRPNYCFGEWDPHLVDNKGNYRRFVVRQITLDGILQRTIPSRERQDSAAAGAPEELLFEAAAVLAGTMLMASGVSGGGPGTHDSSVNLNNLIPRIARYREGFYAKLMEKTHGPHGDRLRAEAKTTRQPFGAARQHLNRHLARQRAWQMQQRHLALLLADIGYPAASRRQVTQVPVASVRILTEMHILLRTGQMHIDRGQFAQVAEILPQIEDLLKRGIGCGALMDPWNILGFQGQYPRFTSLEDSVRDPRIEPLVLTVEKLLDLHARLLSEGAATGAFSPEKALLVRMRQLGEWWDGFASSTVSDVPEVLGASAAASAEAVAQALSRWRERGAASADLAFWRQQHEHFRSPKAFALVVDALLRQQDYRAAMALLMTWLSQVDEVPLEEGDFNFHHLAFLWMLGVCSLAQGTPRDIVDPTLRVGQTPPPTRSVGTTHSGEGLTPAALAMKFFDFLEANAEDYAHVPRLNVLGIEDEDAMDELPEPEDDNESLFGAAYEDMTYKDSTDDDVDAEVLDFMPQKDFDLTHEAERLEQRLRFLSTQARLWNIATRALRESQGADRKACQDAVVTWLGKSRKNFQGFLALLDAIHEHEIPKPTGAYEAVIEYDNRRQVKERLLGQSITACLDQALAVGALRGVLDKDLPLGAEFQGPGWEPLILRMERALLRKEPELARSWLPEFIEHFRSEPLLYAPLNQGGHPRLILRACIGQTILRGLVANLPRQGLLRETYQLARLAHAMEQSQQIEGPRVTEYDRIFHLAVQAAAEAVVEAARREDVAPQRLVAALETTIEPFLDVWMEHSKTLRVAALEGVANDEEWRKLRQFIETYGHDLFTARFLALANLRGILHRGIGAYLDSLAQDADPLHPCRLIEDLNGRYSRQEAERWLQLILPTLIENYTHYLDYDRTTTQSDYGEQLHRLFDFLRLKASYERNAWQLRPLNVVHEILARKDAQTAQVWREQVQQLSRNVANEHLDELTRIEAQHGIRLATVRDRLEERFVQPMELDSLCALVEPALDQAADWLGRDDVPPLEEAVAPFVANPTGVGLDLPPWLQRLQNELQRVRNAKTELVHLAETLFQVPKLSPALEALEEQMRGMEKGEHSA
ncbi:MAG: hypothetical protein L0Y72_02520 [Gemmataceae bacterium]|nr:hypothetical protein [Gemmataceae bacterium]MCI0737891.1 hypothetical protein [Gemmataceae bacterium]